MQEYPGSGAEAADAIDLGAGAWDEALLGTLAELNERMLAALQEAARSADPLRRPALVERLHAEWCALEPPQRRRLATCPYLLLDAGFGQVARWERLGLSVSDAGRPSGYFGGPQGVALVRSALLFAWHLARSNRLAARVLLGMCSGCAERIAASRLQDLELTAEQAPAWVIPRWEQQPRVWRQLFSAARLGEPLPLHWTQLRGLQLLAAV